MQTISPCRFGSQFIVRTKYKETEDFDALVERPEGLPSARALGEFVAKDLKKKLGFQKTDVADMPSVSGTWGHRATDDNHRPILVAESFRGGSVIFCPDQYDDLVQQSLDTFTSTPAPDPIFEQLYAQPRSDVLYTVQKSADVSLSEITHADLDQIEAVGKLEKKSVDLQVQIEELADKRDRILQKLNRKA